MYSYCLGMEYESLAFQHAQFVIFHKALQKTKCMKCAWESRNNQWENVHESGDEVFINTAQETVSKMEGIAC